MTKPSDNLISILRNIMTERKLTVAALAGRCAMTRAQLKRVLGGRTPMTVDDLFTIIPALKLTPEELASHGLLTPGVEAEEATPPPINPKTSDEEVFKMDPWGNHTEQIFKLAFGLGVDILIVCDTTQLAQSGIPDAILTTNKDTPLSLSLDAAFHSYNKPAFSPSHLTLTLSFDDLYTVNIPWSAILKVMLSPEPPAPDQDQDKNEGPSILRLVT